MHYACLLRNDVAIIKLLKANARTDIADAFGKYAHDYYRMEISEKDLEYRYGSYNGNLNRVCDSDNHYFSTQKKCLSALRWYIAHIVVNQNILDSELSACAESHLKDRRPVYQVNEYHAMMKWFQANRPAMNIDLAQQLVVPSFYVYQKEKIDQYPLALYDLLPRNAISINEKNEIWIELQELQTFRK